MLICRSWLAACARSPNVSEACPYCLQSQQLELLVRKKLILRVFQRANSRLIFRYPQDGRKANRDYYHDAYAAGSVTEAFPKTQLFETLTSGFKGQRDQSAKHRLLKLIKPRGRGSRLRMLVGLRRPSIEFRRLPSSGLRDFQA